MGEYLNCKGKEILNQIKIGIGFHGSVEFGHPASVGGLIVNTTREIADMGCSIKVFCGSSNNLGSNFDSYGRIQIFPFGSRPIKKFPNIYAWQKIFWISWKIANSNVDIVHIHQRPELVIGYYIFKTRNPFLIFHVNSHPNSWIGKRFERAIRKADLIISASKFIKKRLVEKFPFLQGKIEVLYNGVDTRIFKPIAKMKKRGDAAKDFLVFFAGNIWKEKGFDVLLKAAKGLQKENVKVLIAGSFTPETNPLHKQFEEHSPENVAYLGLIKHDDLPEYCANADITVIPSRWEDPCPLVVMEAMSCGTPVIGSRTGGIPELIDNEKNGLLITPGSVSALKDAIVWCKNHPNELKNMGVEARKKALRFDWKIISEQLRKIYEEILS